MKSLSCQFEGLAEREGFNASVRHIKTVVSVVDRVAAKENLADIVAELVEAKALDKDEIRPVVSMVLSEKFKYTSVSANLMGIAPDLAAIPEALGTWNGVDLVLLYYHPDLGALAVNPKNPKAMSTIDRLNRSELLVVYAGRFAKEGDAALQAAAAQAVVDICSGREPKVKPEFLSGECAYKAPRSKDEAKKEKAAPKAKAAPDAAQKRGKKAAAAAPVVVAAPPPAPAPKAAVQAERAIKPGARMTPMYSVVVSNELFHNGNVEAWKRIIQSYNAKHPDLEVLVYYDGERITNLNALFKWGKVKHGSTIQFAIAGEEISDVAKLQRYLVQGASRMYEAFLKGPVNSVMALF